jgi:hypothetical protein
MRFDQRIFCSEADIVSLSYTPCYIPMARHCLEEYYVVADPFTNMLVLFFMSDCIKATNTFLDLIPRELHEQYMTDCTTEYKKIHEHTEDCNIPFKYGLVVAFARKS